MTAASRAFDEHLTAGESPVTTGDGSLFRQTWWTPSSICVTDRRILFVPEEGGFLAVPRDRVQTIRSRPTTRRADREIGALLLLVGGVLATALAVAGVLAGSGGLLQPLLATAGAVGVLATAAVVASDAGLADGGLAEDVATSVIAIGNALPGAPAARNADGFPDADRLPGAERVMASERLPDRESVPGQDRVPSADRLRSVSARSKPAALEGVTAHRRVGSHVADVLDQRPTGYWLAALVGTIGAGGLVAVGAWATLGLTVAAAAGLACATYGLSRVRALGDRGERVERERSVCLYLIDGRTVRFRIDDDADLDRELSRLTAKGTAGSDGPGRGVADESSADRGASTGP